MKEQQLIKDTDIAIIGMSCRLPGASNTDDFWKNLRDGVESISFFTDEELMESGIEPAAFKQPNYVKAGAVLPNIELFDAPFFDFSPREAEITDPQHRLFLECAWESLENAGYALQDSENVIGVFAGSGPAAYLHNNLSRNSKALKDGFTLMIGNDRDFLPTRVSYKLNLRGLSVNVQTACSTSLVAVHMACQSLLNGECDITLAGAASIAVPQKTGYQYEKGMINSPDGHCRAFDAKAQGTVGGNGVGIVVLKRLEQAVVDNDHIHALIKGSAINNDGFLKIGYTAPGVEGQTAVISEALAVSDIEAETISYIETHGTGTELGDPIEIAALTKAFQETTEKRGFCAVGSLKTNIGHTNAVAGVAGLIKTALALKHQLLPPSLHFENPNPQIDFVNSPFYVNTTLSEWKSNGMPRRAGVSSFGIGGTNAHVILEEAPALKPSEPSRSWQLLTLSAKTLSALDTATANLVKYLTQHPNVNLADVAYTLHCRRRSFRHRRMLVCQTALDAAAKLNSLDPEFVLTHFLPAENMAEEQEALSSLPRPDNGQSEPEIMLNRLGREWLVGGAVDWSELYADERRLCLPLPTYPFERQRYWIGASGNRQPGRAESLSIKSEKIETATLHSRSNMLKSYVAPSGRIEQTIADIWSNALGIKQISVHDDFFDLGGDSLIAVQVIARLKETLRIDLDAHSLLNKSTIAALAELIEDEAQKTATQPAQQALPSCLVPIQTGNTLAPPLFLMHPVGGHIYFYRDMVEQLGDAYTVYGLQALGVDGKTEPLTLVEEMAAHYIEALRIIQPEGPYFLGGASFGGTLAFEMAQQFNAMGQQVDLLALMDTPGPGHMPVEFNDDAEILAYMLKLGYDITVSLEELRRLEFEEQFDYCIKQIAMKNKENPDIDLTHFRTVLKLFKTNSKAMRDYTPEIYPGKIHFFRAKERDAFLPQNPELAWIDLALEGTETHVIPGNHITMTTLPNAGILAHRLKICLDQNQGLVNNFTNEEF